jgi:hypothetical protein
MMIGTWRVRSSRTQRAQRGEAVHAGQHDVQEDQVRRLREGEREALLGIAASTVS